MLMILFLVGCLEKMVDLFVEQMKKEFELSMVGELTYFLGFKIKQLKDDLFISQSKYARSIGKKFGLEKARVKRTPTPTHFKLSKDADGSNVDKSLYRSIIESLLYLTAIRITIAFAVGVCARYQSCPKSNHLLGAKRIIKDINGTSDYRLYYTFDTNSSLVSYSMYIGQGVRR